MNIPEMPIFAWFNFSSNQLSTLLVLAIVCTCSALFCFIIGEITRNNSQMDKLWSILPIAYVWIIAGMGGFKIRLIIIAILVTYWGVRLTINFGRKGAYSIKFWTGKEDYRWQVVRNFKVFKEHKWLYSLFNFFFISIYQNAIVLLTCLPALALMDSEVLFNWLDIVAIVVTFGAITYELIADEQQWKFQETKWKMIKEGKKLEELPDPYKLGFNTTGLWNYSRHPNYVGEQLTWVGVYIFSIAAGVGVINWSLAGAVLLILLFLGSSTLAENISSGKYLLYKDYKKKVFRYFPFRRYIKR